MKFTEEPSVSSGGGMYLKIADGESVYCILRGDIKTRYVVWNGTGYDDVPKGTEKASLRFKVNAFVFEDKKPVPKILEGGGHLYFDFKEINKEYPLEETMIKISRAGIGKNTRYSVLVAGPKQQPTAELLKTLGNIQLHSLESKSSEASSYGEDEVPY